MEERKLKIFLIPGLGFDRRIFGRLDFGHHDIHHISWIEPLPGELLEDYSLRMCKELLDYREPMAVIGHSLGGIVAQYLPKISNLTKIVLLSTITSRKELPILFKLVVPFGLQRLFTKEVSIRTIQYWGKAHGYTSETEQDLFKSMVGSQSNRYLQWALKSLSTWTGVSAEQESKVVRIHGSKDKTFPIDLIDKCDIVVEEGSHIMAYTKASEIGSIILNVLMQGK